MEEKSYFLIQYAVGLRPTKVAEEKWKVTVAGLEHILGAKHQPMQMNGALLLPVSVMLLSDTLVLMYGPLGRAVPTTVCRRYVVLKAA